MGAWGVGIFENDWALDWIFELEESDLDFVKETLVDVCHFYEKESNAFLAEPTGSQALVAAEVVAALANHPAVDLPEEVQFWLEKNHQKPGEELLNLALRAVVFIRKSSEIQVLWEESEYHDRWLDDIENLIERLE